MLAVHNTAWVEALALLSNPLAEILVEGELSPFEHEALYRALRKGFRVDQPSYTPFDYGSVDSEQFSTRINITFHHDYTPDFFIDHLRESWRELKELIRQVRYRRGRAGAAFALKFVSEGKLTLIFRSGLLDEDEMGSALDQIGHLTGIIGRMIAPATLPEPFGTVECFFDKKTDRWYHFEATTPREGTVYRFDEKASQWKPSFPNMPWPE